MQKVNNDEKCYFCNEKKAVKSHTIAKIKLNIIKGEHSLYDVSKIKEDISKNEWHRSTKTATVRPLFCDEHEKLFKEIEESMRVSLPYNKEEDERFPYKYKKHIFNKFKEENNNIRNMFPFLFSYRFLCAAHYDLKENINKTICKRNKLDNLDSKLKEIINKTPLDIFSECDAIEQFKQFKLSNKTEPLEFFKEITFNTDYEELLEQEFKNKITNCNNDIYKNNGEFLLLFISSSNNIQNYCYANIHLSNGDSYIEYLYPINEKDSCFVIQSFNENNYAFLGRIIEIMSSPNKLNVELFTTSLRANDVFCNSEWEDNYKMFKDNLKEYKEIIHDIPISINEEFFEKIKTKCEEWKNKISPNLQNFKIHSAYIHSIFADSYIKTHTDLRDTLKEYINIFDLLISCEKEILSQKKNEIIAARDEFTKTYNLICDSICWYNNCEQV